MQKKSTTSLPNAIIPYNVLVGKVIQQRRERSGKSQTEVAVGAGLTQSAYSRIELGQTALSVSHLRSIARTLNFKADAVIAEADRIAVQLEIQGVKVPDEKPDDGDMAKSALLIGLGILLAVLAGGK
jgi:transcriptional regulator with XRE-family HTH domain